MGQSTDAILCYGFLVVDENGNEIEDQSPPWLMTEGDDDDDMVFSEFLARLEGLEDPGYDSERYATDPEFKKKITDFWAEQNKLEDKLGITLVRHCCGDYPQWVLATTESYHRASRGNPMRLGQSIEQETEWRGRLKAFCERAGIPFQEPEFILCSYWD